MRIVPIIALMALLGVSACLSGQTRDENWKHCTDYSTYENDLNPDLQIGACTALIQSGQETDQNLASEYFNRGGAYIQKKDMEDNDRSIQDFDQALRLNPSNAGAYEFRGLDYMNKKNFDLAIQDFGQAQRLDPNIFNPSFSSAFFFRGVDHLAKGEYDLAIQDFDQGLRLRPDMPEVPFDRGVAYLCLGQFAAAQPDFAATLKKNPSIAYVALFLYLAQSRAGQDGRSGLEQDAPQIKLTAWPGQVIDLYLGRATPAAILSAASDPNPRTDQRQHSEAYFFLAEHALLEGRRTGAERLFQQAIDTAVEKDPNYAWAQNPHYIVAKEELKLLRASQAKAAR